MDDLAERGVSFERYDGFEQDERGHLARRGRSVHRLVHGPGGQHPGGAGRELGVLAPAEVPRDVREERLVGGDLDEEPAPGRGQRDHGRVLGAVAVVPDRARRRGADGSDRAMSRLGADPVSRSNRASSSAGVG